MAKVGVHVWAVKDFKGCRYLEKRATFILPTRRRSTHVLWRMGKGAIGIAWADEDAVIANVEHLQQRAPTAAVFCAIPRRDRYGLSWREYQRSRHYRAVLAVPLRVGNRVRGCLSVDLQLVGLADQLDTLSTEEKVNDVLAVCEAVLAKRL
jgi:hypothetical protein